jgi:hypothetical protein
MLRGQCNERCSEEHLIPFGTHYRKSSRDMWKIKGRKHCRNCSYGIVSEMKHCPCCGRIFAYKPKCGKAKRLFNVDIVRF